jgi:hypothetical protein
MGACQFYVGVFRTSGVVVGLLSFWYHLNNSG